jgi:hypothetical protein
VADLHAALNDPGARTEVAEILRGLIERISVRDDLQGHMVKLTGDIVKLITLPGGSVPAPFDSSVKVVAGARNRHYLLFDVLNLQVAGTGNSHLAT